PVSVSPGEMATYRIRFKPHQDLFRSGTNPVLLLNELRELGTCSIIARTDHVPQLEDLDPEGCFLCWDIILTSDQGIDPIRDIFIFVEDLCELTIAVIDSGASFDDIGTPKKIGEILVERGDVSEEVMGKMLQAQKRIGEVLVMTKVISKDSLDAALVEQQHVKDVRAKTQQDTTTSSIRVDAIRLDGLVNLVGELVTVQARLSQRAEEGMDPELHAIAEEVERLTGELRDNTMGIRMMPIGTIFSKFKRLVRDLSRELGKEVVMTTEGEDTELDKTVIEKLNDPFVHLIRNSIDHGIEMPATRVAAGKTSQGTVHLSAIHSGDSVIIEIIDDGAGLDREALRRKAIEKGLISEQSANTLTDQEIDQIIFMPGFSTAKTVTNVSGRGVGMDVVKRGIESLRGSIQLSSEPGLGSVVRIRLPLTLAIIESLLVKIGEESFVLPLGVVEECIELSRDSAQKSHGRNMVNVRGHLVPYIPLRESFSIGGELPEIEQIVITNVNNTKVGFVVDNVIGQHQTVIKTLGPLHRDVRGISGATILGDGSVALILDVPQLVLAATAKTI
ncbi:MAG: chemotaxis protein CheA, partial [Desulfobulbaceae bacterium]|nr:chemotaxis protein CheA [Desulfobulbaceae bacterium]